MSTKEIKYGLLEGRGIGKEMPVAATQYFQRRGGHFVYRTAGNVNLCSSMTGCIRADGVVGWADVPKDAAGYNYWVSSSTAGSSKVFVITETDAVYAIPWNGTNASLTATLLGRGCDIIATPLSSGMQMAQIGKVASPLILVGFDKDNLVAHVKIKASKKL